MTTIPSRDLRGAATRSGEPRFCGLDAQAAHDRHWHALGWRVVRRGDAATDTRLDATRSRYLLLERDQVLLFDPRTAGTVPSRRSGAALLVRVEDHGDERYTERVVAAATGRLDRIERRYSAPPRAATEVLLTRDPALARAWSGTPGEERKGSDPQSPPTVPVTRRAVARGRIFRPGPEGNAAGLLAVLGSGPGTPPHAAGATEVEPGVWAHESAVLGAGARFAPPVWIGAGARIDPGEVVVGPCVIPDRTRVGGAAPPGIAPRARPSRGGKKVKQDHPGRRLFDIVFAALALLVTAPVYPLIMLAIWREDGRPFFFAHVRQTIGGRNFTCWKFRTMCRHADEMKGALTEINRCDGPHFNLVDDPRLLRVGRLLRRYYLDELPQLFNVLLGHMQLIGPRPSPDEENRICPAWREARLAVRPGLTGLWQVSRTRAQNTDFQEWIRYDLEYLRRRSWRLDLWILLQTVKCVLLRRGSSEPVATVDSIVEAKPAEHEYRRAA